MLRVGCDSGGWPIGGQQDVLVDVLYGNSPKQDVLYGGVEESGWGKDEKRDGKLGFNIRRRQQEEGSARGGY